MKWERALKTLRLAGFTVTSQPEVAHAWNVVATRPGDHYQIEVSRQDDTVSLIRVRGASDHDELQSDYFGGHFAKNLKQAIESQARSSEQYRQDRAPGGPLHKPETSPQHLTLEQLATLKAAYAPLKTFPVGGPLEARARATVAKLHSVALAQILAVNVKFLDTLAMTELRRRGEATQQDQLNHVVDVVARNMHKVSGKQAQLQLVGVKKVYA